MHGNVGIGELKGQTTDKIPDGGNGKTGAITFGNLSWNNKKASVVITKTTTDSYTMQYKVVNSKGETIKDYQTITSGSVISGLNLGDFVIARLTDGINYGNTATLEVTETGKPTVTVTKGAVTGTSVSITVGATDAEAGMPDTPTYKVYVKKTTETEYPANPTKTSSSTSITIDGLTSTSQYDIKVTVEDIAKNVGEKELKGVVLNTPPTFTAGGTGTATGNTSITITATAKDNEQTGTNALTYTLNYGTSASYGKTKTVKGTSGQQVSFNLTQSDGLSNYALCYWRVDVTDGIVTSATKGTSSSTRTWCGLASYCQGYAIDSQRCTSCSGGMVYYTCGSCGGNGNIETQCKLCSGRGYNLVSCRKCGGMGYIDNQVTCSRCSGVGTITLSCNGTRSTYWGSAGSTSKCWTCNKTVTFYGTYTQCSGPCGYYQYSNNGHCKGCYSLPSSTKCNGTYSVQCDKCFGDKMVTEKKACPGPHADSAYNEKVNCSSCGATGKQSSTCTNCSGNGTIAVGCSVCGGDGLIDYTTSCGHGYTSPHYWCETHKVNSPTNNQYHQ